MKVVCAWCLSVIGGEGPLISHGICQACRDNPEVLKGTSLSAYADTLPFPVIVVNSALEPVAVNRAAVQNQQDAGVLAHRETLGAIVECEHARNPTDCGQTIHCTGCVLRNTASKTNETGEPFTDVPATLSSGAQKVFYYISTRKMDGHVMVKLERPKP